MVFVLKPCAFVILIWWRLICSLDCVLCMAMPLCCGVVLILVFHGILLILYFYFLLFESISNWLGKEESNGAQG